MTKEERQEKIDDYLLGRISPANRKDLERTLADNPEWQAQLDETRLAMQALEQEEDRALKARLQALEADLRQNPAGAANTPSAETPVVALPARRWWLGIAAAVLLLLAAGWFVWQPSTPDYATPRLLAEATFEPYENLAGTLRGDAADAAAFAAYDAGQYAAAATAFAALPPTPVRRFYQAQSLLAEQQYAAAASLLQELTSADFGLQAESTYFLALAHLGVGDVRAARRLLEQLLLPDAAHPDRQAVEELLAAIEALPAGI